jgi:hypothetical protein
MTNHLKLVSFIFGITLDLKFLFFFSNENEKECKKWLHVRDYMGFSLLIESGKCGIG